MKIRIKDMPGRISGLWKSLVRRGKDRKISFALKTTAVYTMLFGVILVIVTAAAAASFTSYSMQSDNLERAASFLLSRLDDPRAGQFDFESFAEINKVYIEIASRDGVIASYGQAPGGGGRYLQTIRHLDKPNLRNVMIKVVSTERQQWSFGGIPQAGFVAVVLLLLAAAAAFGSLKTKQMLKPVYTMTQTARSITANDLSVRIHTENSNDELQELAETFNGMLDRLEESYEQQNRFVSDASHELRTPLSVISGYANLLRRWGSGDKNVLNESVEKIVEETGYMQQLVNRLLFLARADKRTQRVCPERFSLSELLDEIAKETRMIDSRHTLSVKVQNGIFLTADRALLKQAVRAVLDNSIKYTPAGGDIGIVCAAENGTVHLTVKDTGIGISEKDLPHIFDRFYKADEARTRSAGGCGLGLSIVRWIVERHGGRIEVSSTPGSGTSFHIFLPQNE